MLAEGRTLREVLRTAELVYGKTDDRYERQARYLATLGALRRRPWGDEARGDEIRRTGARVARGEV